VGRAGLNLSALGDRLGGAWEKFKDLGAEAPSAPEPTNDDHLYADGAVFGACPCAPAARACAPRRAPPRPPPVV
jgi:hypothetical protein